MKTKEEYKKLFDKNFGEERIRIELQTIKTLDELEDSLTLGDLEMFIHECKLASLSDGHFLLFEFSGGYDGDDRQLSAIEYRWETEKEKEKRFEKWLQDIKNKEDHEERQKLRNENEEKKEYLRLKAKYGNCG